MGVMVWIKSPSPRKPYLVRKGGQNFEGAIIESMGRRGLCQEERAGEETGDMEPRKDMSQGGTGPWCWLHLNLQGGGELKTACM